MHKESLKPLWNQGPRVGGHIFFRSRVSIYRGRVKKLMGSLTKFTDLSGVSVVSSPYMNLDRHQVSGSLTGSRVLTRNLKYYYDNREARLEYQREYYASKRDFIRSKRKEAHAKDETIKRRKHKRDAAYYRKNRVKIALRRREEAQIARALRAEEAKVAEAHQDKKKP